MNDKDTKLDLTQEELEQNNNELTDEQVEEVAGGIINGMNLRGFFDVNAN